MSATIILSADRGGTVTFSLASHQSHAVSLMNEHPHYGIFAETGTGKTMIALTWIYDSLISGRIDDALVICPASLIDSWKAAIDKMAMFGYSDFEIGLVRDAITLISYNSVWVRNKQFARKKGTHKHEIRPSVNHHWGAIICDESHRLGDPSSVQTKVILRMSELADYRFVMSGTPHSMRYVKMYGQLKFLEPTVFADYKDFERRYVLSLDYFGNPVRYDSDALESLIRSFGISIRLRDCFDMPESTESDIPIQFTPDTIHSRIRKDLRIHDPQVQSGCGFHDCRGFSHEVLSSMFGVLLRIGG